MPATPDSLGGGGGGGGVYASLRPPVVPPLEGEGSRRRRLVGKRRGMNKRGAGEGEEGRLGINKCNNFIQKRVLAYFEGKAYFWRLQYYHNSKFNRYT